MLLNHLLEHHLQRLHGRLIELLSDPRDDFLSLLAVHGDAQCQLHYPLQIRRANLRVSRLLHIRKAIDDFVLAFGLAISLVKLGVILVKAVYD